MHESTIAAIDESLYCGTMPLFVPSGRTALVAGAFADETTWTLDSYWIGASACAPASEAADRAAAACAAGAAACEAAAG